MSYKEFMRDRYFRGEIIPWWKGYVDSDGYQTTIVAPLLFNILFHWILTMVWFVKRYPVPFSAYRRKQEELLRDAIASLDINDCSHLGRLTIAYNPNKTPLEIAIEVQKTLEQIRKQVKG